MMNPIIVEFLELKTGLNVIYDPKYLINGYIDDKYYKLKKC